jgi:hypothetical protein
MQMYSFPRHHHISGVSRCLMASLGRPRSGSFARFLLLGIRKSSKCSAHDALDSHAHNSLRKGTRHFESAALRAARREMGVAALLKHGPHLRLPPLFADVAWTIRSRSTKIVCRVRFARRIFGSALGHATFFGRRTTAALDSSSQRSSHASTAHRPRSEVKLSLSSGPPPHFTSFALRCPSEQPTEPCPRVVNGACVHADRELVGFHIMYRCRGMI